MQTDTAFGMSTSRLEAFSDGVIAIIITVMVFDLKLPDTGTDLTAQTFWPAIWKVVPRFVFFGLSFLTLGIMWVNHHRIFHQIARTDVKLLWLNMHLLFWMSLVPFGTSLIGSAPWLPEAAASYGFIFFVNAWAFSLLRQYAFGRKTDLLAHPVPQQVRKTARFRNYAGMMLYAVAFFSAFLSVYIALLLFILVPLMYILPQKPTHLPKAEGSES